MKMLLITLLSILPLLSSAEEVILERELFNARNGESYVCKLWRPTAEEIKKGASPEKLSAEIINDGTSLGLGHTRFQSNKTLMWIDDMKKMPSAQKVTGAQGIEALPGENIKSDRYSRSHKVKKFLHRGVKQYSVYDNGKKVPFYKMVTKQLRSRRNGKSVWQSVEYKISEGDNKSLYNQLRGQADVACRDGAVQIK